MLDNAMDLLSEGFLDNETIAETLSRTYGVSPCDVLETREKRSMALESLEYILEQLTPEEAVIVEMTAKGSKSKEMAEKLGLSAATISWKRKRIPVKIQALAEKDPLLMRNLERLYDLLQPPESKKEMTGKVSLPAYSFERAMAVNMGMKEGIQDGYRVMKTVSECHLPEYMSKCFSDGDTCCMLCTTCRRKKVNKGRGNLGLWNTK